MVINIYPGLMWKRLITPKVPTVGAIRFNEQARIFYQKKAAKTKRVVAIKALSHKLARACYYVIKNNEDFDSQRLFAS